MPKPRKFPFEVSNKHCKVTIYQTKNGQYSSYKIVWKEGKFRRKESRATEELAIGRAEEILHDITNASKVRKDASADRLAYLLRCEEALGGTPLHIAVNFYLKNCTHTAPATVGEVFQRFIEAKKGANTSDRYLDTIKYHSTLANQFAETPISEVTTATLDSALLSVSVPRTRANFRKTFVTVWKWAQSKGYLADGVKTAAERTETPVVAPVDPGIITPAQLAYTIRRARPEIVPYMALAAFAGIRSAEICRMTWEDNIMLDLGAVVLGSNITKTRRRRVIVMEPNLIEWLSKYKSTGSVVKTSHPHELVAEAREKTLWKTHWPHNALRHSAVSYLMAKYQNAATIASQCGHSESEMQASYKAAVTPDAAKDWFAILPDDRNYHTA